MQAYLKEDAKDGDTGGRLERFVEVRTQLSVPVNDVQLHAHTRIHNAGTSRQTQPPTLSGTGNEYQPKCGDALRLGSKGRYGSFHLWINMWVAGKIV